MLLVCHFTQKTWKRGDLFPILTTNDSSIFLSNSVNHGQGLMCLKFKPLFLYKQHPRLNLPYSCVALHSNPCVLTSQVIHVEYWILLKPSFNCTKDVIKYPKLRCRYMMMNNFYTLIKCKVEIHIQSCTPNPRPKPK